MINTLFGITWGDTHKSIWFIVCFALFLLLVYRYAKKRSALLALGQKMPSLLIGASPIKQLFKMICMGTGIVFLFIALLRPQKNETEEIVMQEGRDLYIALDISRSMLASDCAPNRLLFAKEKIKSLVKKLSCDRVGLILFSGSAFVQCPLTTDYSAFFMYLDAVDAELISSGTTALDQAIGQALTSFAATPDRKNKLLIIFTDGEDFSYNLADVKQKAIDEHLSIFTVGIGTPEGAPVPLFDEHGHPRGHQKDAKGAVVISRLNEPVLRTLSNDAGGRYVRAAQTDEDLGVLINAVYSFEKEQLGERKLSRLQDQYHYCLLVSFICFMIEWLL